MQEVYIKLACVQMYQINVHVILLPLGGVDCASPDKPKLE